MMSTEPKQQHFVAQSYLKPWSHEKARGKYFCYLSRKNQLGWREANIKSIMKEGDIYTIIGSQGEKDRYWEGWLGDLENRYAVVRDKVSAGERTLSPMDHDTLAHFVSAQIHRTPANRKNLVQGLQQLRRLYEKPNGAGVSVPFMVAPGSRTYQSNELIEALKKPMTHVLLPEIKRVFDVIRNMKIIFIEAVSDFRFLTSDNPVFIRSNYPSYPPLYPAAHTWGMAYPGTKIFMPISPTVCALLTWTEAPKHSDGLSPGIFLWLNASICHYAEEWIISSVLHAPK